MHWVQTLSIPGIHSRVQPMSSWRSEDQESLRKALQSHGLDETSLARSSAISLAQLRELVHGGEGQFYSAGIKAHVGYKLMRRLGLEPTPQQATPEILPDTGLSPALPAAAADTRWQRPEPAKASRLTLAPAAPMRVKFGVSAGFLLLGGLVIGILMLPGWRSPGGLPRGQHGLEERLAATQSPSQVVQTRLSDRAPEPSTVAAITLVPPEQETRTQHLSAVSPPCDWSKASVSTTFQTEGPTKAGNYVHFVAERSTTVCVVDQAHKITELQLKEGEARSIYGEGPFLVHLQKDASVKLFFQGRRVPMTPASGFLVLQPVPLG